MKLRRVIEKYKFATFLSAVIILAIVMVGVSMRMYYLSGAFQLDLSRPEYTSVRDQIDPAPKHQDEFLSQGDVTTQTLDDFLGRYKGESSKVLDEPGFSDDSLSDDKLGIPGAGSN